MKIFRNRKLVFGPLMRQKKFYFSSKNDDGNNRKPPAFDLFDDTLDEVVDNMTEEYLLSKGRKLVNMPKKESKRKSHDDPLSQIKE